MLKPRLHRAGFGLLMLGALALGLGDAHAQRTTTRSTTGGGQQQQPGGFGGQQQGGTRGTSGTSTYPNNTMVGDAMITVDPETRQIIVITDDETNINIKEVIKSLDKPKPQVLIKVVFLQVTHGNDLDLGIEGKYTHKGVQGGTNIAQTLLGIASQTTGGFYKVLNDDLEVTIRALNVAGKTEILSRPSILARNNQQATIVVGQEVPLITGTQLTQFGSVNTVTYQDVGIILRVTPFITADGLVEMIIAPEISSLSDRTVEISSTASVPVIDKRSADTVVVTPSGKTVVIGGLMSTQKIESDRKVPILGDIPLIGYAFKRKVKSDAKTELLIFMTPIVVQHPADLAKLAIDERNQLELAPKVFKEKDVNRMFDGDSLKQPVAPKPSSKKPAPAKTSDAAKPAPKE